MMRSGYDTALSILEPVRAALGLRTPLETAVQVALAATVVVPLSVGDAKVLLDSVSVPESVTSSGA